MTVLDDFHQYRTAVSIQRLKTKVIKDQEIQTFYFIYFTDIGTISFAIFNLENSLVVFAYRTL